MSDSNISRQQNLELRAFCLEMGLAWKTKQNKINFKKQAEDSITHFFQDQSNFLCCGRGVIYTYFVCTGEGTELNIVVIR